MVGDGRAARLDEFIALTQRAVSCITPAVVLQRQRTPGAPTFLTLSERFPPLSGPHRLSLTLLHACDLRPGENRRGKNLFRLLGYWYQIHRLDGNEVVAFRWHPGRTNQVAFPHPHIESCSEQPGIRRGQHIPTGRVSLDAVVRFAIDELGVHPLREDWRQVLQAGIDALDAGRSWSSSTRRRAVRP